MTDLERFDAPRAVTWKGVTSIAAWLVALLLLPVAARPSCQTPYCQHRQDVYSRTVEEKSRTSLAADPTDFAKWQGLLQYLAHKPARERQIARYLAHVDWEARPELEIDLEARLRQERAAWIADWKQAFPGRGEPWCEEAALEASPEAQVELLLVAAARLPDDAFVRGCLAQILLQAGRGGEAEALLESFLDRHPNDFAIHSQLVNLLHYRHAPAEEIRAALEEGAQRFHDNPRAREELLRFYDTNGQEQQRDRLLAEIEASDDFNIRNGACGVLFGRSDGSRLARARCLSGVLDDFPAADMPESERYRLDHVRDGLLMTAIHGRDWPAIRGVLARWPSDNLGVAWQRIADWTKEDGCRAMRAAWSEGALRPALAGAGAAFQAGRVAWAFRRCGDAALAAEVERPFVADATDEDLAYLGGDAALAEKKRRAQSAPQQPRRWREVDNAASTRPLAERLPDLLAWHEAAPTDPEPALRLSRAYATAGKGEEAVRWLLAAAERHEWRGTDLQLQAAALAFRFRLHDLAAATARKALAAPATPRQHAEAHYLLGRVALREGRREEAASELLRYFPLRMRFVAGCDSSPDHGLLLLLLANYDLPRLRTYLEDRRSALTWFGEHLHHPAPQPTSPPKPGLQPERYYEPLSCLAKPLPPPLKADMTLACVPPGAYEYLSREDNGAAPAAERSRRRNEAKDGFACPPGWPGDLESFFDDERLLSFSEPLTSVD